MNDTAAPLSELSVYFGNILTAIIPLIGILSFIMILIGGFAILTAGSDSKGLQGGKQTITYAVIGLILAIASWLILVLIKNITGVNVTKFKLSF